MELNSLLEIGSKANVIIRFLTETEINGKTYFAGEPYLYLKDINIMITYKNVNKIGTGTFNTVAGSRVYPNTIIMGNISFSRKLAALLASYENTNTEFNPTKMMSLTGEAGMIFLPEEVKSSKGFYVYDENFSSISVTYDSTSNALLGTGILQSKQYLVFFSSVKVGTRFNLAQPCVPYMSLEIQGIGNIDKITKSVTIYFNKVSLNSVLQFNFLPDSIMNIPLEFQVIDNEAHVIFED